MRNAFLFTFALLSTSISIASEIPAPTKDGLTFSCAPAVLAQLEAEMSVYLAELAIKDNWIIKSKSQDDTQLNYQLNTPDFDTSTKDFSKRPEYAITPTELELPGKAGKTLRIQTVSKKEIMLALMQHGRTTVFAQNACSVEALRDHIGIRQNTVAWAEVLEWNWPDGGSAYWNKKYWRRGTPKKGHSLHTAVNDAFINQDKYSIGCYTATKLLMLQGVLDYYFRVKNDYIELARIEEQLNKDGEPLVNVEPGIMWNFESDYDHHEDTRPGTLLQIQYQIAKDNFVPGDWLYFLNTDTNSYQKTGYEGSNAVYLGLNRFDDYYNDNNHAYSYSQKLDEVYQWRNGVFSRSRDAKKIKPLSEQDLETLSEAPDKGGLLNTFRVFPYQFGSIELTH